MTCEQPITIVCFTFRDRHWGRIENGKWNGQISSLLSGDADVMFASVTFLLVRAEAIDYLYPIETETNSIFISKTGQVH